MRLRSRAGLPGPPDVEALDPDVPKVGEVREEEVPPKPDAFADGAVVIKYEVVVFLSVRGEEADDVSVVSITFVASVRESERDGVGSLAPSDDPISGRFDCFGGDDVSG